MKLEHELVVPAPIEEVWSALLDLERVGACMPGAHVKRGPEDSYHGTMRVKLGPVTADYTGTVKLLDVDEERHMASIELRGRETRGHGSASAIVTNHLEADGHDTTRISFQTDLKIAGRAAQLGAGILQDVAAAMFGEFSSRLASEIAGHPIQRPMVEQVSNASPGEPLAAGREHQTPVNQALGGRLFLRIAARRYRPALIVVVFLLLGILAKRARRPRISLRVDLTR